jgi:hypothetical protein
VRVCALTRRRIDKDNRRFCARAQHVNKVMERRALENELACVQL